MKDRKISSYAAVLIIVLVGSAATLLIVDAGTAVPDHYVFIDPFDITADFGQ